MEEHAQELLATTQAVLDRQAAAWIAACAAIGGLLTQLCQAYDKHKEGHAALGANVKKTLEMTQEVLPDLRCLLPCHTRDIVDTFRMKCFAWQYNQLQCRVSFIMHGCNVWATGDIATSEIVGSYRVQGGCSLPLAGLPMEPGLAALPLW